MQDAHGDSSGSAGNVPLGLLESVRDLNRRFLGLLCGEAGAWSPAGRILPIDLAARMAPLSAAQRSAAASCPYALFDLRFGDRGHWQRRLRSPGAWAISECPGVDAPTLDFVRLAVFFAWHVARSGKLAPPLLLGMDESTAAAFRGATIDCLPTLAVTEAAHLTARWHRCARYWSALAGAASRTNSAELRRIQLYGLQLAAAARLG